MDRRKIRIPLEDRFWSKVLKTKTCWNWTASLNLKGYGQFRDDKSKHTVAHQVSWKLHYGNIPYGLNVLHKCNNPKCVNPEHLYLGTHTNNARDRIVAGTAAKKLSKLKVQIIRRLYKTGKYTQQELSVKFGVFNTLISRIVRNEIWKEV